MHAAKVNRSAWQEEDDAVSDTPMLCDTLDDIEAPLRDAAAGRAAVYGNNDLDGGEDEEDWAGERGAVAGGNGDGGEALEAWLDQYMEQIPSSSTTDDVVNIVKRAALQFGEAARLALLSRRVQQIAEDGDLGAPGQEEEREYEPVDHGIREIERVPICESSANRRDNLEQALLQQMTMAPREDKKETTHTRQQHAKRRE